MTETIVASLLVVVGAAGLFLAMPRGGARAGRGPLVLLGAAGAVLVTLLASAAGRGGTAGWFVGLSVVAVAAAIRMITHRRPVYSALYFVLVVVAVAGLVLLLGAEFLAAALVIIYAGAILITYLFVIMLATQAPSEGELEALAEYDAEARSPAAATVASFALLAVLTTMLFSGADGLEPRDGAGLDAPIEMMPRRAERSLREAGAIGAGDEVVGVDAAAWTATLRSGEEVALPESARLTNVERIGHDLLAEHPGSIEIAGVILLMAMLGATVLSRRQVELEDEAKRRQAERLAAAGTVFADREVSP